MNVVRKKKLRQNAQRAKNRMVVNNGPTTVTIKIICTTQLTPVIDGTHHFKH